MSTNTEVVYSHIEGFPGYRVGTDGSVWRQWVTCRAGRKLTDTWRLMKLSPSPKGYLRVNLVPPQGGTYTTFMVHRLVLEAFVGPCPEGMECRHFPDRDKANNRLENLSWATPEQNVQDNRDDKAYKHGEDHHWCKLTADSVREIRAKRAAGSTSESLAVEFNTSVWNIYAIIARRSWTHI